MKRRRDEAFLTLDETSSEDLELLSGLDNCKGNKEKVRLRMRRDGMEKRRPNEDIQREPSQRFASLSSEPRCEVPERKTKTKYQHSICTTSIRRGRRTGYRL